MEEKDNLENSQEQENEQTENKTNVELGHETQLEEQQESQSVTQQSSNQEQPNEMQPQAKPTTNEKPVVKPETKKCLNCGAELKPDEDFCPKCGTKYGKTKKIICPNCHNEVEFGMKFCGKCGAKIDLKTSDKIDYVKNNFTKKKMGKKILIILIIIIALIFVGIIGKNIYSALSVSVDELISQEKYEDAYKKAKTDEDKNNVLNAMMQKGKFQEAYNISQDENVVLTNELAYYCNEISEGLKDPTSFSLREVYFDREAQQIVFSVNGTNSYGGTVVGYWYYTYNSTDKKYSLFTYVSDLDDENTYSWDTSSERLEKALKNIARTRIKTIMSDDNNRINNQVIDNINTLFKNETLKNVEFPNYATIDNSDTNSEISSNENSTSI